MKIVEFTYTIGSATFSTSAEVEQSDWEEMEDSERLDFLEDQAIEEIRDMISVEEDSITIEDE